MNNVFQKQKYIPKVCPHLALVLINWPLLLALDKRIRKRKLGVLALVKKTNEESVHLSWICLSKPQALEFSHLMLLATVISKRLKMPCNKVFTLSVARIQTKMLKP